ncbi:hypothetical protein C8Q77DRAFT_1117258 [Trametes polyzona]|nr:hypothetical protein C8Q77DRAFT_1117258 [Trametes polyzona]
MDAREHYSDIASLKAGGFRLCLAKKVNNTFNVVWQGGNFLYNNLFTWNSQYQVFGSNHYNEGTLVQASTEVVNIQPGLTATLDSSGVMHLPGGAPDQSGTFYVNNRYGEISIGVNENLNGTYSSIFVTPTPLLSGQIDLTPVEEVLVWFDTSSVTGSMITQSISNSINVDFTQLPTRAITYTADPTQPGAGIWAIDSQLALSRTYDVRTNRFTINKPSPALLAKMTSILSGPVPTAPLGATPVSGTSLVRAHVEFDSASAAAKFAGYLRGARPHWTVSNSGASVEVGLKPAHSNLDSCQAIQKCENAFLKVYQSFRGLPYKTLAFEVVGTNVSTAPIASPPTLSAAAPISTGKTVVRFNSIPNAEQFAATTASFSGDGVTLVGVLKGVAVVVTASLDNPTADPVGDRLKVSNKVSARIQAYNTQDHSVPKSITYTGPIIWNQDLA